MAEPLLVFCKKTRKTTPMLMNISAIRMLMYIILRNNNSVMCISPHCTCGRQHSVLSLCGEIATHYDQEDSEWLKANPG
jgi:hypothetical protein